MIQVSNRWEFYKDRLGEWQWRKFEANKVVAVSAIGFYSRQACIINASQRGYDAMVSRRPQKRREVNGNTIT